MDAKHHRGDLIRDGSTTGRYVGTTPAGVDWICWTGDESDYQRMCGAFDAMRAPRSVTGETLAPCRCGDVDRCHVGACARAAS